MSMRRESGKLTLGDLPSKMSRLKVVGESLTEDEREAFIQDLYQNMQEEVDFELFLRVRRLLAFITYKFATTMALHLESNIFITFFISNFGKLKLDFAFDLDRLIAIIMNEVSDRYFGLLHCLIDKKIARECKVDLSERPQGHSCGFRSRGATYYLNLLAI